MNPLLRRFAEHTEVRPGAIERLRAHFAPPSAAPTLRVLGDIDEAATLQRLRAGRRKATGFRLAPRVVGGLLVVGAAAAGGMAGKFMLEPGSRDRIAIGDQRSVGAAEPGADLPSREVRREPAPVVGARDPERPRRAVDLEAKTGGESSVGWREVPRPTHESASETRPVTGDSVKTQGSIEIVEPVVSKEESLVASSEIGDLPVRPDGSAGGQGTVTTLAWEVGTFEGSVEPPDVLLVTTREAQVRVEGGAVTIHRDRRGTTVNATSDAARVRCGSLAERPVPAEGTFCLPVSAAGWLGRGQALRDAGAPNAEVLAAADAGLTFGADDPAFGELIVLRVACLRAAGRHAEARAAARLYPKDGPRAAEVLY